MLVCAANPHAAAIEVKAGELARDRGNCGTPRWVRPPPLNFPPLPHPPQSQRRILDVPCSNSNPFAVEDRSRSTPAANTDATARICRREPSTFGASAQIGCWRQQCLHRPTDAPCPNSPPLVQVLAE